MTLNGKEAVIKEFINGGKIVYYTVADGATIEKGTLCVLTDPRTAAASTSATSGNSPFAGIAMAEKVASDGSTSLGFLVGDAVVDLYAMSGQAITPGMLVRLSGANMITGLISSGNYIDVSGGAYFGNSLETTAAATAETIQVLI